MSLFANLYVGNSGLTTSQNALNTTAHNMANVGTPGYTRQQITQATREYTTQSKDYRDSQWAQTGLGVFYNNCKQVRSVFLDQSFRLESGRSSFYETSYHSLAQVEDILQELNGTEFKTSIDNLWTAAQELSKDPSSATNQAAFVNRSGEFIERSRTVYDSFKNYQTELNDGVFDIVQQINRYGDELLKLNKEICQIEVGGREHANDLRDRRNQILDELGKLGEIDYKEDTFHVVHVSFAGTPFVMSDHVNHMACDTEDSPAGFNTPYWEFAAVERTNPVTNLRYLDISNAKVLNLDLPVSSKMNTDVGKLRSTLLARGDHHATYHDIADDNHNNYTTRIAPSVMMNLEAEFDQLFHHVCAAINEVMQNALSNPATVSGKGHTKDFVMFQEKEPTEKVKYKIGLDYAAGDLLLGISVENTKVNPVLVHDPTTFDFVTKTDDIDNEAMEALKKAFTEVKYTLNPNVTTRNSLNDYYSALVSQVATSGSVGKSVLDAQKVTVSGIRDAREQIVGVSQDEELQFMIQFQNAFNANSRYINVVSEMLDHLLRTLGG